MNIKIVLPCLIIITAPVLQAYRGPEARRNGVASAITVSGRTVAKNEKYVIDDKESVVTWKCSMAFAGKGGHNGYISLSKGDFTFEKGQLAGGRVEVDMSTIADEFHRSDNNLINHLKGSDFFDVDKFPTSMFVITQVSAAEEGNINVTGELTIKGITHEVTFPAKASVQGRTVNAEGKVTIDRTQWDVRYRSGSFFDNLADEAISDDIELDMKIVAKK